MHQPYQPTLLSRECWLSHWHALGAKRLPRTEHQQLLAAWDSPGRHYHNLQHAEACLNWLERLWHQCQNPHQLAIALWFHDAVYDPTAHDNEAKSRDWAVAVCLKAGLAKHHVKRIDDLIMLTVHGKTITSSTSKYPTNRSDNAIMVDIDLSILGSKRRIYQRYCQAVRQEYQHFPNDLFLAGRQQVLRTFLAQPSIYKSHHFQQLLELSARKNLQQELSRLSSQLISIDN